MNRPSLATVINIVARALAPTAQNRPPSCKVRQTVIPHANWGLSLSYAGR